MYASGEILTIAACFCVFSVLLSDARAKRTDAARRDYWCISQLDQT